MRDTFWGSCWRCLFWGIVLTFILVDVLSDAWGADDPPEPDPF